MRMREFSYREVIIILRNNGYEFLREGKGDHRIFSNGKSKITLPIKNKTVNPCIFRRLIKENNLIIN